MVRVSPAAMDDKEEVISVSDIRALHEAVSHFKDDTKEILMELIEDREEHVEVRGYGTCGGTWVWDMWRYVGMGHVEVRGYGTCGGT